MMFSPLGDEVGNFSCNIIRKDQKIKSTTKLHFYLKYILTEGTTCLFSGLSEKSSLKAS